MSLFTSTLHAAGEVTPKQPNFLENMIPFLLIFAVMYFIIIRPQAKKAKNHENLMTALKPGDEVVTSGGIIGRIKTITDEFISLDTGTAVLKIQKSHIAGKTAKNTPAAGKQEA